MPSATLAAAAHQLVAAGFEVVRHEYMSAVFGNEYYELVGLGTVVRLVHDRGDEEVVIQEPHRSSWSKPSRWLRTDNHQMSFADCVAMVVDRKDELRLALQEPQPPW